DIIPVGNQAGGFRRQSGGAKAGLQRRQTFATITTLAMKAKNKKLADKLAAMSDEEVARLLRKSHRIRNTDRTAPARGAGSWWSATEEHLLGGRSDRQLAKLLGRSVRS